MGRFGASAPCQLQDCQMSKYPTGNLNPKYLLDSDENGDPFALQHNSLKVIIVQALNTKGLFWLLNEHWQIQHHTYV